MNWFMVSLAIVIGAIIGHTLAGLRASIRQIMGDEP